MSDELLRNFLRERGQDQCPKCGKAQGREDFSWSDSSTEAGTGLEARLREVETELTRIRTHTGYKVMVEMKERIRELEEELAIRDKLADDEIEHRRTR